jgi:hypothetical protein
MADSGERHCEARVDARSGDYLSDLDPLLSEPLAADRPHRRTRSAHHVRDVKESERLAVVGVVERDVAQ